jgi:hypothetical protein
MDAETVSSAAPLAGTHRACRTVAVASVLLHLGLVSVYVAKHDGQLSALLCASERHAGRPPFEAVTVGFAHPGYDGQSYYAVARNPWRLHIGENVEPPAVWHQRIVYPLLCWLGSGGGHRRALLWAMPAVNLLAIGALAWLGAHTAGRCGRSPWWGFVLPLAVNALLPALRNLTDAVSTLAVLGLLLTWLGSARPVPLFLWGLAVLFTREQNLAVVALVLLVAVGSGRRRAAVLLALVPVLWLLWVTVLARRYGHWPFVSTTGNLGRPCAGIRDGLAYWFAYPGHRKGWLLLNTALWHTLVLLGWSVVAALRCGSRTLALFLLGGVVLAVLGGPAFYCDPFSYRRVLVWHTLGLWLYGVRRGGAGTLGVLALSGFWSAALAAGVI